MASRIILTASSASLATNCGKCSASFAISSDLVSARSDQAWFLLSSLALSSAPRLVVPVTVMPFWLKFR